MKTERISCFLLLFLLCLGAFASAEPIRLSLNGSSQIAHQQAQENYRYFCEKVLPGTVIVDGELSEPAWKVACPMGDFKISATGEPSKYHTTAKMLWDGEFLYCAFECEDFDVWSTMRERDQLLFLEEVVEVFIAPHGPEAEYYEFEFNPFGTIFDLLISDRSLLSSRFEQWLHDYNSKELKCGVKVQGTVNDIRDVDEGWSVEIGIPLRDLLYAGEELPRAGERWRINLYRSEAPKDAGQRENSAWSPTGPSFHVPEKFGELVFAESYQYVCQKVPLGSVKIDGRLNEAVWQEAKLVSPFKISKTGTYARLQTEAKLLWDEEYLYLAFECEDDDVWATMTERDEDIWSEEVVEVFFSPAGMVDAYYEFEINPLNNVLDILVLNRPGIPTEEMFFIKGYDSHGLKKAVQVRGTVNNREDIDRGWTVEFAIPFADILNYDEVHPKEGDVWRLNLYRCDVPKDKAQAEYSAWCPTSSWFHIPEQFGMIIFSEQSGTY